MADLVEGVYGLWLDDAKIHLMEVGRDNDEGKEEKEPPNY